MLSQFTVSATSSIQVLTRRTSSVPAVEVHLLCDIRRGGASISVPHAFGFAVIGRDVYEQLIPSFCLSPKVLRCIMQTGFDLIC